MYLDSTFFPKVAKKKNKKTDEKSISIPTIHTYKIMLKDNYSLQQLKTFAKHYKLKISGTKNELITRIFTFLQSSYYTTKIQKVFRGNLQRKFNFEILSLAFNMGLGKALNEGLKKIRFRYCFRADSDDINLPNRFEKQLFFAQKGYKLIGSSIQEIDFNGNF